jgi:Holliday junction DNA helicase RuvA
MIGHLEGIVKKVGTGMVVLSAHGVGYKVACTRETAGTLQEGGTTSLWTHLAVREDSLDLYGFAAEDELRFFELLLTVSGIGPKSALGILDIAAVETLRSAIAGENAAYLTNVSGIGKKTAEKIVLELKDKVGKAIEALPMTGDAEALEAMRALGYSAQEARDALRKVPAEVTSSSERLREALRIIGTRS